MALPSPCRTCPWCIFIRAPLDLPSQQVVARPSCDRRSVTQISAPFGSGCEIRAPRTSAQKSRLRGPNANSGHWRQEPKSYGNPFATKTCWMEVARRPRARLLLLLLLLLLPLQSHPPTATEHGEPPGRLADPGPSPRLLQTSRHAAGRATLDGEHPCRPGESDGVPALTTSGPGGMAATWASRTMTATDPFATGPCGSVTPDARWKASHRANKATLAEPWVPNDASTARTDLPHHGQCWPRPQAPPCGLWHPAWMQQRTPPTSRLARWTRVQATPVPRQSCWPAEAELQLAGLGSTPQVLLPTGAWPLRGSSQDSANRRQYGGQPVPRRFTTATNQPG